MKAEEIHASLKAKDINYTILAEALGVSSGHVRNVAERIYISKRVAQGIAAALGRPFHEVFPEYAGKQAHIKQAKRKKAIATLKKQIQQVSA